MAVELGERTLRAVRRAKAADKPSRAQSRLVASATRAYHSATGREKERIGEALGIGGGRVAKTRRRVQEKRGEKTLQQLGAKAKPAEVEPTKVKPRRARTAARRVRTRRFPMTRTSLWERLFPWARR